MRASDIVNQLAAELPKFADDFTNNFSVVSLTRSSTTVTVTTSAAHGLAIGQKVNITGALTPISCSITRSGIVATLVTTSDHDITENAGFDVQVDGATEANFNGTFTLLSVPNRRTITYLIDDSGATTATGAPLLLNGSNIFKDYNGIQDVTSVPTTTSFTYEVADATLFTPASGTIVVKSGVRISAAANLERLVDSYTKGDKWLFVVLGDSIANKSRRIDTDAINNLQRGNYFDAKFVQTIALYVFFPTTSEIGAANARDRAEELLKPICNSILWAKFPSLVENSNNPLQFVSHGFQAYNSAFYVHEYSFEASLQFGISDTFTPDEDVAFRDIDMTTAFSHGTGTQESLIDLDDEPIL